MRLTKRGRDTVIALVSLVMGTCGGTLLEVGVRPQVPAAVLTGFGSVLALWHFILVCAQERQPFVDVDTKPRTF